MLGAGEGEGRAPSGRGPARSNACLLLPGNVAVPRTGLGGRDLRAFSPLSTSGNIRAHFGLTRALAGEVRGNSTVTVPVDFKAHLTLALPQIKLN